MKEKLIIKADELTSMVSEYIMMGSEAFGTEMVYSNIIPIKDKECFMYCYVFKIGNDCINCNQVLFKTDIINIISFFLKNKGYAANDYEIMNDENLDLLVSVDKIKDKQKTIGAK